MPESPEQINNLLDKVKTLLIRQEALSKQINELQADIYRLKISENQQISPGEKEALIQPSLPDNPLLTGHSSVLVQLPGLQKLEAIETSAGIKAKRNSPGISLDLEKFVGENLINKIGIAITIIGVAIGAKYSIDHKLISPLARIILGYLMGIALLGFGIKLKKRYESYSAVLVSGAMAIMYFMTYAAYSFYGLIPQSLAFLLMVLFTIFTVGAAIRYDRQVIAHIGLVGAYAVPFLLGNNSGKVTILFSYMAIINVGILVISFKKYWKQLLYAAFSLTWLIFLSWYVTRYDPEVHFKIALSFAICFFVIFYTSFLAYKIIKSEAFGLDDIILILINSFIFYGVGYAVLHNHPPGNKLLGLYTVGNAMVHFIISFFIYKRKLPDKYLFYLECGLVIVFITIAVPVQLDGNWVTVFWAAEAALLFGIGRAKSNLLYERLSYPLMILAFLSILQDWTSVYDNYDTLQPGSRLMLLLNINFLTSVFFTASFGLINYVNSNKKYVSPLTGQAGLFKMISFAIPAIFLFVLYFSFCMEIANYWDQFYIDSVFKSNTLYHSRDRYDGSPDLLSFKTIWLINYSTLFLSLLSFVNIKKIKSQQLGVINIGLNALAITSFLIIGIYSLSDLRQSWLHQSFGPLFESGSINILIRYACYGFVTVLLLATHKYANCDYLNLSFKVVFELLLYLIILWIVSSELINLMELAGSTETYKLGLSILWGLYALMLIAFGIIQRKKHLRVGAIALFAVTLLKLFFYDIADLDTISKTIVFVSLGVTLLIISFLYNKYKDLIAGDLDQ